MTAQPPAAQAASPSQPRPPAKSRLQYIDNLRIVLISMVVLLHLAITYGAEGDWFYNEKVPDNFGSAAVLTLYTSIAQAFTLAFFMMIASYFNPPAYDRKGAGAFARDKLKRLGIPLVLFWAVVNPLLVMMIRALQGEPAVPPGIPFPTFWLNSTSVGPMWFVELLLILSLLYAVWRLATSRRSAEPPAPPPAAGEAAAPGNGAMALFALVVALVTFVVRLAWPVGRWLEPFHLQLAQHPQYIAYFLAGIFAYRHNWFAGVRVAQAKLWAWLAVGLMLSYPVIVVLSGAREKGVNEFLGGVTWQSALYSFWEQFLCIAIVVALLVWFRERFNHQGKLAAAMGLDTYAVYFIHPAVIIPLAYALSGIVMVGLIKWILVAPLALALCFLVAHGLRKLPGLRAVL
jgi:glucan biosynthesis protein C